MELAICEAPPVLSPGTPAWDGLVARVRATGPDALLLNEMPFGDWIAHAPSPDRTVLEASHRRHLDGRAHLGDLGAASVLSTQATYNGDVSVNEGFVWEPQVGATPVHTKQFFPDEPGFHEARWYARGARRFEVATVQDVRVGFLICTDVMFLEWARYYGRQGAHLIVVPRATPRTSLERWKTVIASAAIVSGCYVASSNRNGTHASGFAFGGRGWLFDPTGTLMAETTPESPVVCGRVDPARAERAQREYPCYVEDLPAPSPDDTPRRGAPAP